MVEQSVDIRAPGDIGQASSWLHCTPWSALAELVDDLTRFFFYFRDSLAGSRGGSLRPTIDSGYEGGSRPTVRATDDAHDAHGMDLEEISPSRGPYET